MNARQHSKIRAISFDAGDTLIFDDPPVERRIEYALLSAGLRWEVTKLPQAIHQMQRLGLALYLDGLPLDSPDLIVQCSQRLLYSLSLPADFGVAAKLAQLYGEQPFERRLHPSALLLLEELKRRGFLLAVISDWEPDLPNLLLSLGIYHLLDCVSVSSVVGAIKPSAKLFRHALEGLDVPADQVIHVGDYAELDAAGAIAVGMQATVYDRRGIYRDARPSYGEYVATFAELEQLLLSLSA